MNHPKPVNGGAARPVQKRFPMLTAERLEMERSQARAAKWRDRIVLISGEARARLGFGEQEGQFGVDVETNEWVFLDMPEAEPAQDGQEAPKPPLDRRKELEVLADRGGAETHGGEYEGRLGSETTKLADPAAAVGGA